MTEMTLKEFCKGKSQEAAAKELGYSQGWICHLLKPGRDVRVVREDNGDVVIVENVFRKRIPCLKSAAR